MEESSTNSQGFLGRDQSVFTYRPVLGITAAVLSDGVVMNQSEDGDVLVVALMEFVDLLYTVKSGDTNNSAELDNVGVDHLAELEAGDGGATGGDEIVDEDDAGVGLEGVDAEDHGVVLGFFVFLGVRGGLAENTGALAVLAEHDEGDAEAEGDRGTEEETAGVIAEDVSGALIGGKVGVALNKDIDDDLEDLRVLGEGASVVETRDGLGGELRGVPANSGGDALGSGTSGVKGEVVLFNFDKLESISHFVFFYVFVS